MSPDLPKNRREFLRRTVKAGAALSAAGGISVLTHGPAGPGPASEESGASGLPDFSLAAAGRRLCIARGADRTRSPARALQALGGIEAFITPGDRVLIKVNAAFASPPLLSATTHPELVSELTRLCLQAGAAVVRVTDNPINGPASCFAVPPSKKRTQTLVEKAMVYSAKSECGFCLQHGRCFGSIHSSI